MKAKMIVYNNHTGIVNLMNPLFESEGIQVIVAKDYTHLVNLLKQEHIQKLRMIIAGQKNYYNKLQKKFIPKQKHY